jgi:hypothetical protein
VPSTVFVVVHLYETVRLCHRRGSVGARERLASEPRVLYGQVPSAPSTRRTHMGTWCHSIRPPLLKCGDSLVPLMLGCVAVQSCLPSHQCRSTCRRQSVPQCQGRYRLIDAGLGEWGAGVPRHPFLCFLILPITLPCARVTAAVPVHQAARHLSLGNLRSSGVAHACGVPVRAWFRFPSVRCLPCAKSPCDFLVLNAPRRNGDVAHTLIRVSDAIGEHPGQDDIEWLLCSVGVLESGASKPVL